MDETLAARREARSRKAREDRALLDAIPEPLREDYLRLNIVIDDLDVQIADLQKRRRGYLDERSAIMQMAAEAATADAQIVALRHSSSEANEQFRKAVSAMHPNFYHGTDYLPMTVDGMEPDYSFPPYVGLHIALHEEREQALADLDTTTLAEAMVGFADRFVTDVETGGEWPGLILCRVLTSGDDSFVLRYAPDGSEAALLDTNRFSPQQVAHGTLVAILDAAVKRAIRSHEEAMAADEDDLW